MEHPVGLNKALKILLGQLEISGGNKELSAFDIKVKSAGRTFTPVLVA